MLSETNYTSWLIAADEFADRRGEPGYELAGEMFTLLTGMLELQTLVRMSSPDTKAIEAKRKELAKVQEAFTTPPTKVVGRAVYSLPFGPYYMGIMVDQDVLVNNPDALLSVEPIRYMTVTNCRVNDDFAALLRNYRTAEQWRTSFRFRYPPREVMSVAKAVEAAHLYHSLSLTLQGVNDRNSLIATHFRMAKNVSCGVKLLMGNPPREVAERGPH
jgi:hypothetical protein